MANEKEVVTRIADMIEMGVTQTPTLAVNGEVVSVGRVLDVASIKKTLTPLHTEDPVLASRQANERQYLDEVADGLAERVGLVPWLLDPPVGTAGLLAALGVQAIPRTWNT